ncbi:hypothetical protein QIO_0565 [Clostridioides difficile DA00129]|nr:hypothetical protein QIO_0565 [Clostridioides difficile DA00129]
MFYYNIFKKYLEKFANDRFQNIVDEQELDLTNKEFKNYKKYL